MAFDGVFLHQITASLQVIVNQKITKIYQISDTEILFILKANQSTQLMISCHSSYNRIHLSQKDYPTRSTPSNFIMLLRKYLEGGYIVSIKQVELDRYLIIEVASHNDIGDRITLQLYVELMGKYANLILVNEGKIIDALKHIPPFENTIRTIQPGALFKPATPQSNKIDPFAIETIDNDENLFERLLGFSPLLSEEIQYRLHTQTYQEIKQEILNSHKMYITTINDEQFFHCIPLTHLKKQYEEYEISEGLDHLYYAKEEKERIRQISGDLFKFIRKETNKCINKIDRLNNQLEECKNADINRYYGDLIFAYQHLITKGDKQVRLIDFEGREVTIPLDNKLDGKGNGKKYFKKYHKLSTGIKYVNEQLAIAQENLEYFQQLAIQLEYADFASANEIKTELQQNGYLRNTNNPRYKNKKQIEPNYQKIELDKHTILIGKNNIQNDFITFKKANRFDYWFHVKDCPGSHVVINNQNPDEKTIRTCAMIAAYYSKERKSSSIAVNYTQVKELKKIPNSKLGKVIMKTYKTIYIDVDEKYMQELLNE